MEEKKTKRKSPHPPTNQAAPPGTARKKITSSSRTFGLSTHSNQKARYRSRAVRDKPKPQSQLCKSNQSAALQHSFLTDVSDVQEMEKGLLSLLNDFHSGKLQAFGNECSIDEMEHVREMQEKLARLHFDLYGEMDKMPEEERKLACDTNMDNLLLNDNTENCSRCVWNVGTPTVWLHDNCRPSHHSKEHRESVTHPHCYWSWKS